MSFQQGLSGLNAAAKNLDIIGNNVANGSTVGFKASQGQFADVYAASLTGAGGTQIGIGTKLATVSQQFTQGNITTTNNPLDVAINGKGFFRVSDNGTIYYARAGQFQLDADGYLVTSAGYNITGYPATSTGTILTGSLSNIQLSSADLAPSPTSDATLQVQLDARDTGPTTSFNYTDPTTYNDSTSMTVYDSLGNGQTLSLYFQKSSSASNLWNVYTSLTNSAGTTTVLNGSSGALTTISFTTAGAISSGGSATQSISAGALGSGAAAMSVAIDFSGTTQFGANFGVSAVTQDGYASGRITGFGIGTDGIITARYSNGQTLSQGQLVLADFTNPQGLQPLGNTLFAETSSSGQPLVGAPASSTLGVLQSSATEDSNVDLTAELVSLITAQRAYQASAQSIKTQDQVLQTLVNLR